MAQDPGKSDWVELQMRPLGFAESKTSNLHLTSKYWF